MDLVRAREKAKKKKAPAPAAPVPPPEETPVPAAAAAPAPPSGEIHSPPEIETAVVPPPPEPSAPLPAAAETPPPSTPPALETEAASEPEEAHELLGFTLGPEEYGIEIQWIEEIIKPRPVTEVPRVPDYIPGLISLRGRIIPIVDLQRRLRLPPSGPGRAGKPENPDVGRIIVVSDPATKQPFGLRVGEVTEVIRLPFKELEPPPPTVGGDVGFITGVGWVREKMVIMLNLKELLKLESAAEPRTQ